MNDGTAPPTCPGCWSNTLTQTLAASDHRVAWYQCTACPWAGSALDLAAPTTSREVLSVLQEDTRRRAPGGSDDGLATVPAWWSDRQAPDWDTESHVQTTMTRLPPKNEVVQIKGIRTNQREAEQAMIELLTEALRELRSAS